MDAWPMLEDCMRHQPKTESWSKTPSTTIGGFEWDADKRFSIGPNLIVVGGMAKQVMLAIKLG
jgi:hypothetical protein